jgi:hypothetical protein
MALDKNSLESKIATLLSLDMSPSAENPADCANKISDYVDEYLSEIELGQFAGPGIGPGTSTGPPPGSVVVPASPLLAASFREALVSAMSSMSGIFVQCGPAYQADMATMTSVTDDVYTEAGTSSCPVGPNLDLAFNLGKAGQDHTSVAREIANQIHIATTSTTYSGTQPYASPAGSVGSATHSSAFT